MWLIKVLEIWQTVANCSIVNGVRDLAPVLHESAVMDSFSFDLNSIKLGHVSHNWLFEMDSVIPFNYPNASPAEKMMLLDKMLSCAVLIVHSSQVT